MHGRIELYFGELQIEPETRLSDDHDHMCSKLLVRESCSWSSLSVCLFGKVEVFNGRAHMLHV